MKVAVFSDIHGNITALDAVLGDIATEGVDAMVCLGDIAAFGPRPLEVTERLRDIDKLLLLRGNTERWLGLVRDQPEGPFEEEIIDTVKPALSWTLEQLPKNVASSLTDLPPSGDFGGGDFTISFEHASPGSDILGIQPLAEQKSLDDMFRGKKMQGFVCGHTHKPFIRRACEKVLVVNSGSVGLPYDEIPRPSWAIVEITKQGIRAGIRRVDYDRSLVQKDIKERKMVWGEVIEDRLEKARMS